MPIPFPKRKCSLCKIEGHNRNNILFHPSNKITLNKITSNKIILEKTGGNGVKSLKNEDCFINIFNSNPDYKKNLFAIAGIEIINYDYWIAKKPILKEGFNVRQTEFWNKLKVGTKEISPSPKTDVVLTNINNGKCIGISLKSGEGRATSADGFETNSIIRSTLLGNPLYLENQELNELVNSLLEAMLKEKMKLSTLNMTQMKHTFKTNPEGFGFDKEFEWFTKFESSRLICNKIWKTIITKFPKFKNDVICECLSGKYKFGDNIGKANYLVKLENSSSTNINKIIDLSCESIILEDYCKSIGNGNVFAAKSAGTTLWMRFL
jgi:hypothetical protein